MGNHRADVTSDSPRSVTPSPGAPSGTYVGKRRAAPADRPAARPAPTTTGPSYVGKRRAAHTASTPEEPVAKTRPQRVVLDSPDTMPSVGMPPTLPAPASPGRRARHDDSDPRISTGELRALVEGDGGSAPEPLSAMPVAAMAHSGVPSPRRAPQIDPQLAGLLSSMGIDPEKVTPDVLDGLGIGGMSTTELTAFLTQPTKPAPLSPAPARREPSQSRTGSFGTSPEPGFRPEPRIRPLTDGAPAAALPAPSAPPTAPPPAPVLPPAPEAPLAPEPTFAAPEPLSTATPKPLRMANTFAPLTGKIPAVRRIQSDEAAPELAAPTPAPVAPAPSRGLIPGADTPASTPLEDLVSPPTPAPFKIDASGFPAPPASVPADIDFDSMAFDLPTGEYRTGEYHTGAYRTGEYATGAYDVADYPTGAYDAYDSGAYEAVAYEEPATGYDTGEGYFRADTGSIELASLSEAATYSQELHLPLDEVVPAVETTGTMVGIGDPTRRTTRRAAAAAASGRPTVAMTAGAAAVVAAVSGIALTAAPATNIAADDARLVGATALGGQSAMAAVGDRSDTVTRDSDRDKAASAASDRDKALAGVDVQADKQDKFLKSNQWMLPIPLGVYHITGTFGSAGVHWATVHTGLDFAAPYGTPIHAITRGTVTSVAWGGAYGNRTIVTLPDGTEIWYCHQSSRAVSLGDKVGPGDVIGYVGATGNATGDHLHVEVRPGGGDPVDPDDALAEHGADPTP